jgi:hypothetical protein
MGSPLGVPGELSGPSWSSVALRYDVAFELEHKPFLSRAPGLGGARETPAIQHQLLQAGCLLSLGSVSTIACAWLARFDTV